MKRTLFHLVVFAMMVPYRTTILNSAEPVLSPEMALNATEKRPFLIVMGITQDGGSPQAGCQKSCCSAILDDPSLQRNVSCLAIVDPLTSERWLIDATPDFKEQLHQLDLVHAAQDEPGITGIFLTHGHMGHYTGLIHLGREAMGARDVPVYSMPKMIDFLSHNGPWDQLVLLKNISLHAITDGLPVHLNDRLSITPFLVPHRDEYTETVGYRLDGPNGSALYIPDIDKWEKWEISITDMISQVSVTFLDGTFFDEGEIPGRDMDNIQHPFIVESIKRFESLSAADRSKVRYIHLNHTNPALQPGSKARKFIEGKGMSVANEGERFPL